MVKIQTKIGAVELSLDELKKLLQEETPETNPAPLTNLKLKKHDLASIAEKAIQKINTQQITSLTEFLKQEKLPTYPKFKIDLANILKQRYGIKGKFLVSKTMTSTNPPWKQYPTDNLLQQATQEIAQGNFTTIQKHAAKYNLTPHQRFKLAKTLKRTYGMKGNFGTAKLRRILRGQATIQKSRPNPRGQAERLRYIQSRIRNLTANNAMNYEKAFRIASEEHRQNKQPLGTSHESFPLIEPLQSSSQDTFRQICEDMINKSFTLKWSELGSLLQSKDGQWDIKNWILFVRSFGQNSTKIADYFKQPNKFKINLNEGWIKYE